MIKFRDAFSARYVAIIVVLAAFAVFSFIRSTDAHFFGTVVVIMLVGILALAGSFKRKVIISGNSVSVSPTLLSTADHGENRIVRTGGKNLHFTARFTLDNIKSLRLADRTDVKSLVPRVFRSMGNASRVVFVEFKTPLPVNKFMLIGYPDSVPALMIGVQDPDLLYRTLSNALNSAPASAL